MIRPWIYLVIVTGSILFKIITVENRYYWRDEIATILHTSGNSSFNLKNTAPVNQVKNITYYTDYLELKEKNLSIASQLEDLWNMPNLNPLHYYFLVFWYRITGDEEVHFRLFSILMFILCLPLLFHLAKTLFGSPLAGWVAISLFSLSSFFHMYSQLARYNMILALVLSASHYSLLKAIEKQQLKYWLFYTISGILLLYASLTAGIILAGHLLFMWFTKRRLLQKYLISAVIIFLAYLPWIFSTIEYRVEIAESLAWQANFPTDHLNPLSLFFFQLVAVARSMFIISLISDWAVVPLAGKLGGINIVQLIVSIFVLIILSISFVTIYRNMTKEKFWFIVLITFPLLVFFFVVDLIRGSITSLIERYQLAVFLGANISLSYFFYRYISLKKSGIITLFFVFVFLGVWSLIRLSFDEKGASVTAGIKGVVNTTKYISRLEKPLLITDGEGPQRFWGKFLAFLNRCESENIYIYYASERINNLQEVMENDDYSDVLLLMLSTEVKNELETKFKKQMIPVKNDTLIDVWQLKIE